MRTTKPLILILFAAVFIAVSAQTVGFQDPDSYIGEVGTLDGKFTQIEPDLIIAAPDLLVLSRFYDGCWRILPQAYLVIGSDQIAVTGEQFGGALKYKGEKVDFSKGMVNTYAGEVSGKTNLQNNRLICKGEVCEIVLGNGTKRTYKVTEKNPLKFFLASPETLNSKIYQLVSEKLPSGNILLFSYENGNVSSIEMKDATGKKVHAWIHFNYQFEEGKYTVTLTRCVA